MATTTTATEVSKRKSPAQAPAVTFADDLHRELKALVLRRTAMRWPSTRYQHDPVSFFRQVLGVEPWSRQVEIIEAVRDHRRVAVCSGHKIGKSISVAGLALWFYCSFADARAVMSSTTARQVDQILWRELRMLRARGGRCTECKRRDPEGLTIARPCVHSALIDGEQGELARTGLKSADFREVVGFTAKEAEAVAGISGGNLLYLLDEASGIPDEIFEAIEGNRAGGARVLLVGNGTRNTGEFFEAFTSKAHLYFTLRISSEESPNVVAQRVVTPGLATSEWIEEKKIEWGENSALYRVRVKGEHPQHEEGKIFSLHSIGESEKRWHDTPEAGRLYFGIDPAGESGSGDETVIVARRGLRMLSMRAFRGLDAPSILVRLLDMLRPPLRLPRETPVVVIDRGGSVGSDLAVVLRQHVDVHAGAFELVTIRPSDLAVRRPAVYHTMRDELAANLEAWMRDGGAIVEDVKLTAELHALEWKQSARGLLKLTPKEVLRKQLQRSPDRYDALSLCAWEPLSLRADVELPASAQQAISPAEHHQHHTPALDPYAGADAWQRR